ncbi:hypothetical protein NBRC10513_002086 [Rhodotorula toruloides]
MPVPPLPLELVRLVLSLAAASLPEVERREECINFARVCKAWNESATALAWEEVSVREAGSEWAAFVNHLCAYPDLCRHIRALDLRPLHEKLEGDKRQVGTDEGDSEDDKTTPAELVADEQQGSLFLDLIGHCTAVQDLILPEYPLEHKLAVKAGSAPFAAHLRRLRLLLIVPEACDVAYLADIILPFRQLTSLFMRAVLFGPVDGKCSLSAISAPYRLALNNLHLDIADGADGDFVETATQAILAVVDVTAVGRLVLSNWTGDTIVFDWLTGSSVLRQLSIDTVDVEGLQALLEHLLVMIHALPNLEYLRIVPEPFFAELDPDQTGILPALLPLGFFLDCLPQSIRMASLLGLFFEGDDGLPETPALKEMPPRDSNIMALFLGVLSEVNDDHEPSMSQLMCLQKVDAKGKLGWYLCVAVVFIAREYWPRLKRILHLARPQNLLIPSMGHDPAYLDALARPSSTSGLRMLHLAFLPASDRLAEDLIRILPKFVQLVSLEIVVRPLDAYHGLASDDPEHHAKHLSVRVLRLNVAPGPSSSGQALVPHWTRSLLHALEVDSVQECILEVETGDISSINRLLSWTSLTQLTIILGEFGMKPLRKGLMQLCSVVSQLELLKDLRVRPEDPCLAIRLSPVTLVDFLSILPPSIQSVELDALSFNNFDGLPTAGLEHLDTDAPRMRGLFWTERDFEEFVCIKIHSASGELEWHVCAL